MRYIEKKILKSLEDDIKELNKRSVTNYERSWRKDFKITRVIY